MKGKINGIRNRVRRLLESVIYQRMMKERHSVHHSSIFSWKWGQNDNLTANPSYFSG